MKKKYGIIIVSIIMVVASTVLLVNKSSYSLTVDSNYCPAEVIVTKSEDTIELVEGIPLPKSLEVKTLNGDTLDNTALTYIRDSNMMYEGVVEKSMKVKLQFLPSVITKKKIDIINNCFFGG